MIAWFKGLRLPRPSGQTLRTIALFMGAPIFGGILVWQLMDLAPEQTAKVCRAFNFSESSCLTLHTQVYGIKDKVLIGLMGILGAGYIMMMMREMRMQGEISTLLGGASFKSDDGGPQPKITTTTTTEVQPSAAPAAPPSEE